MDFPPIINESIPYNHAVGVEEREARSFVVQTEKIQFAPQFAVIAPLRLLKHGKVFLEGSIGQKCRAVYALKHFVLRIAAPIRAVNRRQFHGFYFAGTHNVRTCAQVGKLALGIKRNHRIFGQIVNELHFIIFAQIGKELQCVGAAFFAPHQRQIFLYYTAHFFFDVGKIGLRELPVHVNVVIKAVFNGRSYGKFRILFLIEPLYRLRQNV